MGAFKAAFINEVLKIYKKKKVIVAVSISLFAIVMGQLMVSVVNTGFGLRAVSGTQFPIVVLSLFSRTILPFFTALVVIDTFSGEYSHNTMKITLTRPVSRLKLYTAKIGAVAFFVLMNLMIVMLLSMLVGIIFNADSLTVEGIFRVILAYIVTLLPVMAFALIMVFLTNVLKSGTTVFFLSIIMFIAFNGIAFFFPRYSSLFITSMFDWYSLWNVNTFQISKF